MRRRAALTSSQIGRNVIASFFDVPYLKKLVVDLQKENRRLRRQMKEAEGKAAFLETELAILKLEREQDTARRPEQRRSGPGDGARLGGCQTDVRAQSGS